MNLYEWADQFRAEMLRDEQSATDQITDAYSDIWNAINERLSKLLKQIQKEKDAGRPVPLWWLYQNERLESLKRQAEGALREFVGKASETVRKAQSTAVTAALQHTPVLFEAALGEIPAGVSVNFNRLPRQAVESLVGFLSDGTPLHEHLGQIVGAGREAVERGLIQGVALGQNPRKIAAGIKETFDGGYAQALTVSRTETLRAYRQATLRSYEENGELVEEWVWLANLGSWQRTCAACIAMNGKVMPTNVIQGTHVNCRCTIISRPKPLSEILGDPSIPDSRPRIEDGEAWLKRQPVATQEWILGEQRLAAWKNGEVKLGDFVAYHDHPRWGPTRREASLKTARRNAERRITEGRDPTGPAPGDS